MRKVNCGGIDAGSQKISRGTDGSNSSPSSGESANYRSLVRPKARDRICSLRRGSRRDPACRLRYYPNPKAVAAYHLSRHAEFHDHIPPSTSVVMERCFAAQATISTSLIAVMPEAGYDPQGPSARRSLRPRPPALCRPSVAMNSFSSRARRRTTPAPASTLASSSRCIPPGPAPRSASRLNS